MKKYIVETKINRYANSLEEALERLTEKYLLTEQVNQGYIHLRFPRRAWEPE